MDILETIILLEESKLQIVLLFNLYILNKLQDYKYPYIRQMNESNCDLVKVLQIIPHNLN